MGPIKVIIPFFLDMRDILKSALHAEVNLRKTCLIILQIHDMPHPQSALDAIRQQLPAIAHLPLHTAGAVFVGFPIGHPQFIKDFLDEVCAKSQAEFHKLLQFPFAQAYLQLLRWCACPKMVHLARAVAPPAMQDTAQQFDSLIEDNLAQYFDLKLKTDQKITDIDPRAPLGSPELVALAKYQLRDPEGLAFPATAPILVPAFYAASLRHLVDIAPHLQSSDSLFQHNDSSHLFSDPFHEAYDALVERGAAPIRQDPPDKGRQKAGGRAQQDRDPFDPKAPFNLPHISLIRGLDSRLIENILARTIRAATQQSRLATWYKCNHDDVSRVSAIRANNPSLNARTQHMAPTVTKGPHGRFDLPSSIIVKHRPTDFLTSPLPYGSDGMSAHQLAQYLSLLLGLPLPSLPTPDALCNCRAPLSAFGYHQLNCSKWAGRSWKKGHDIVVKALAFEIRRLGMGAVDSDFTMKHDYAHPTSQKRGDIAVTSDGHLELTNAVDRYPRSDFIIDVKVCAMVTADGDWKARWNADKTVLENHTLAKAEDEKFSKHERSYAAVGYAFFPFVLGCFGGIGSQAARFLCALAFLELRQHDAIRDSAGLPPLSPADRSQFRARCFRQASTRISAALAKATVMRLTGASSLPPPTYLPHRFCASNCPGPADSLPRRRPLHSSSSFSPPSYASSLSSLP